MKTQTRLALVVGAGVVLLAGAALAKIAGDCCCKDKCCDEMTAPAAPIAPAESPPQH